jgi:hypothetical protein
MKIAVHILCYNVDRFILHTISNCYPYVDKIYLAWSPSSWGYGTEVLANPTDIHTYNIEEKFPKCQLLIGCWATEEAMRNACLEQARGDECDWLIIQDADEFYTASSWGTIIKSLEQAPKSVNLIKTTWYNFWKHPSLVVVNKDGSIKGLNAGFALRITDCASFVSKRKTTFSGSNAEAILDVPCFHYGWVLSDEEMRMKIRTWGHTQEFDPNVWYNLKWKRWILATRNLYPVNSCAWARAQFFPGELPSFVYDIFGQDSLMSSNLLAPKRVSLRLYCRELMYDLSANWRWAKYWIRNSFPI